MNDELVTRMLKAATETAAAIGVRASVAVIDGGGNLKAFVRLDGSSLGSIAAAQRKAFTAASSRRSTAELFEVARGDVSMAIILGTGIDGFMLLAGGEPLILAGEHAGGVGVAGGSSDQDREIAQAAILAAGAEA